MNAMFTSSMDVNQQRYKIRRITALVVEMMVFVLLFLIVDAIVLRFVFPGYLDPFWPHHSDYYIPSAIAYSSFPLWHFIGLPRPVGEVYFWFIGHLGSRAAIFAALLVVALNFALINMILRRLFVLKMNWSTVLSALTYAVLLTSHPYQYQMSTWDAWAQLSLLLLLIATICYVRGSMAAAAIFVLLACLSKETYIISALVLGGAYTIARNFRIRSFFPGMTVGFLAVMAMLFEHFVASPFTSNGKDFGGAYRLVFTLGSIKAEWSRYLIEGMSPATVGVVVVSILAIGGIYGWRSRQVVAAVGMVAAGSAALLPNSLLPYHHFAGYSWDAAYLIYAPVLLVSGATRQKTMSSVASVLIALSAIVSPAMSAAPYKSQDWVVMNQKRQERFLKTMRGLIKQIPPGNRRILVTGVDFPYTMFYFGNSLISMGAKTGTKFFIVDYDGASLQTPPRPEYNSRGIVTFIGPDAVRNTPFDEAWLIRNDGSLIRSVGAAGVASLGSPGGFKLEQVLAFPALIDAFAGENKVPGYEYLACGVNLLEYHQAVLAQSCLEEASRLLPTNPYPSYYLGVSFEQEHKRELAREAYQHAVAMNANSPNPAFESALRNLH